MRSPQSPAHHERRAVCDLLDELGPQAQTLPAGWRTAELAAHLWVRERRPDAGPGLVLQGPAKRYTDRLMARALEERGYERLVADVRAGPPTLSVFSLPGVDAAANVTEYFVHTEDVRRAQGGERAVPRSLPDQLEEALWSTATRMGPLLVRRRAKVCGVELATPGGRRETLRVGEPTVALRGEPGELVLWLFGRREAADVEVLGPADAVARLTS